jgi:membrane protease YdiL (CAAX protease family)
MPPVPLEIRIFTMVAGSGGIILTVLYIWRRSLPANMIAHWVADGAGFLMPH